MCTTKITYGNGAYGYLSLPQLSGNGRADRQKGNYSRDKSWESEIIIDNQQKSGVREQSLKKRGYDFVARRAKELTERR
jgi:hypothetical protein